MVYKTKRYPLVLSSVDGTTAIPTASTHVLGSHAGDLELSPNSHVVDLVAGLIHACDSRFARLPRQ